MRSTAHSRSARERTTTAASSVGGGRGLSRRALLGAGMSRVLEVHGEPGPPARRRPAAAAFAGWGEEDDAGLGARLGAVAERLLAGVGACDGKHLVVACAGEGVLARAAARTGATVTAVEASAERAQLGRELCEQEGVDVRWAVAPVTRLPVADGAADAVVSLFGVFHEADARSAAAELARAAAPRGAIALTAWAGVMAVLLRMAGGPAASSPRWARYETAYLHFFALPEFDVRMEETYLRFAGPDEAFQTLSAPAAAIGAVDRARDALPALLAEHGREDGGAFVLRVDYATVFARC